MRRAVLHRWLIVTGALAAAFTAAAVLIPGESLGSARQGDEEFPPNAQVLYSDNFAEGFAAEDRVVAGDILISTIKSYM